MQEYFELNPVKAKIYFDCGRGVTIFRSRTISAEERCATLYRGVRPNLSNCKTREFWLVIMSAPCRYCTKPASLATAILCSKCKAPFHPSCADRNATVVAGVFKCCANLRPTPSLPDGTKSSATLSSSSQHKQLDSSYL